MSTTRTGESPTQLNTGDKPSGVIFGFLVAVIILGGILRFHNLAAQSLWRDEGLTANVASCPLFQVLRQVRITDMNPPLYSLVINVWASCFGHSDWSLRAPSAIAGTAAVAMIYLLGASLFGRRAGLMAAVFLACNEFHIAYSHEARAYALEFLLALTSCYLFVRVVRGGGAALQALYVLATYALVYTHYYGFLVIAGQSAVYLGFRLFAADRIRLTFTRAMSLMACVGLLYLPWLGVMLRVSRRMDRAKMEWVWWHGWRMIPDSYLAYAGSSALLAGMGILGIVAIWRTGRKHVGMWLCVALIVFCVIAPVTASHVWRPFYIDRYGIVAIAGMCLLAGAGAAVHRLVSVALAAVYIALTIGPAMAANSPRSELVDWRELGRMVAQSAGPDDSIFIDNPFARFVFWHYCPLQRQTIEPEYPPTLKNWQPRQRSAHLWIILQSTPRSLQDYLAELGPGYQIARQLQYDNATVTELAPAPLTPTTLPDR